MESTQLAQKYLLALEEQLSKAEGYRSWGAVEVLEMACRIEGKQYLYCNFSGDYVLTQTKEWKPDDLFSVILKKRRSADCIMITRQQNASRVKETIPPILDDQAQLLGPTLRFVSSSSPKQISNALSGRYAVNCSDGRTICTGRSVEETYIAAQLVEKTSKAFLYAKRIGGSKSINRLEAWVMHKFYMLKYSRIAESG